jgi:hypothetical protein
VLVRAFSCPPIRPGSVASLAASLALATVASAQIRVVNYNVAQLNGNQTALQAVFAALNADDKPGWAVAPHLYVFPEVQSADVGPLLTRLNAAAPPGVTYTQGTYTNNNENSTAGAQAMFYRADTFTEDVAGHVDIFTGGGRYTDRWKLRLVGYSSPDAVLFIYSSHLKASTGASNEQERLDGAIAIRNNADALPAGTHIIYAGDYNVYSNAEPAYQEMISAGVAQAIDPLGTGSWGGSSNAWKHTQSPQDNGPLVGGGMDDRFDLQLSTAAFHDAEGLSLISGTYRPLGNDGAHYNLAINSGNNTYYPSDIPRSNTLADNLFDASDHVPLIAEYQLPAVLQASGPSDFGRVIQGEAVTVSFQVNNAASVVIPGGSGADELDFTATGFGALLGSGGGSVLATLPPTPATIELAVDTSATGAVAGGVQFASSSQAAEVLTPTLNVSGAVVRHANASFASDADENLAAVSRVLLSDGGVVEFDVDVHNFGFDSEQALLDVDGVSGMTAPITLAGGLESGVGAAPATLTFTVDTAGLGNADVQQSVSVNTSDEDIPGASGAAITIEFALDVRVLLGDIDGNCVVDLADLSAQLEAFGTCAGDSGYNAAVDLDNDGCVGVADLSILLTDYGAGCP